MEDFAVYEYHNYYVDLEEVTSLLEQNQEHLLEIIEQQQMLINIQNTQLGYFEFITHIVIPLVFIVITLWWFFKQFLGKY